PPFTGAPSAPAAKPPSAVAPTSRPAMAVRPIGLLTPRLLLHNDRIARSPWPTAPGAMPGPEQAERGKGLSRGDARSEPSPLDKAAWLPSKRPLGVYRPGADAHPPGAPGTCQTVSSGGDQLIRDLVLWRADPDDSYALTVGSGASPSPPFLKRRRSALPTESSSSPSSAEKPETSPPSPRSGKTRGTTGGPSTSRSGRGPRGHGRLARRSVFLSVLETVTLSPWGAWKRRADDDVVGATLDNSSLGDGMTLRLGGQTTPRRWTQKFG